MIREEELPIIAIPSMNDTHLEEMLIINRLYSAVEGNNIELVSQLLQELIEHTKIHFANEESLMEKAFFSAYNEHKSEHDRHLNELKSLIKYFDTNKDTRAIYAYVEGNLKLWMIHHIQTMDTQTAIFLEQKSSHT